MPLCKHIKHISWHMSCLKAGGCGKSIKETIDKTSISIMSQSIRSQKYEQHWKKSSIKAILIDFYSDGSKERIFNRIWGEAKVAIERTEKKAHQGCWESFRAEKLVNYPRKEEENLNLVNLFQHFPIRKSN